MIVNRRVGENLNETTEMVGYYSTPVEVVQELEKSRLFFDESGGGVTFSGGEPMMQPKFLDEILTLCKSRELHTAVDTCGYAPVEVIRTIAAHTDLFLFDLKLMDLAKHIEYTGVSNHLILNNLELLVAMQKKIWLRMPVIPGVNDTPDEVAAFMDLLSGFYPVVDHLFLLPFHAAAKSKYKRLGLETDKYTFNQPGTENLNLLKSTYEKTGFKVRIGG
jgi:pyruvate formate lyase activating enzyme